MAPPAIGPSESRSMRWGCGPVKRGAVDGLRFVGLNVADQRHHARQTVADSNGQAK